MSGFRPSASASNASARTVKLLRTWSEGMVQSSLTVCDDSMQSRNNLAQSRKAARLQRRKMALWRDVLKGHAEMADSEPCRNSDKVRGSFTVWARAALAGALGLKPETRHLKPCPTCSLNGTIREINCAVPNQDLTDVVSLVVSRADRDEGTADQRTANAAGAFRHV